MPGMVALHGRSDKNQSYGFSVLSPVTVFQPETEDSQLKTGFLAVHISNIEHFCINLEH